MMEIPIKTTKISKPLCTKFCKFSLLSYLTLIIPEDFINVYHFYLKKKIDFHLKFICLFFNVYLVFCLT